jgi:glycosylphosphatidylinositol deacylase
MVPSVVSCIEANLRFPLPLLLLAPGTSVIYYLCSLFGTETPPPLISFLGVSLVCYIFANGVVALLAIVSSIIFQAASFIQVFFKLRLVSKFCVYLSISTTHMIIKLLLQF